MVTGQLKIIIRCTKSALLLTSPAIVMYRSEVSACTVHVAWSLQCCSPLSMKQSYRAFVAFSWDDGLLRLLSVKVILHHQSCCIAKRTQHTKCSKIPPVLLCHTLAYFLKYFVPLVLAMHVCLCCEHDSLTNHSVSHQPCSQVPNWSLTCWTGTALMSERTLIVVG